jgi:hypothetical protein
MPPGTTRIFPGEENPLALVLELSEKLRFSEPCPLSPSDGFRAAFPSLEIKHVAACHRATGSGDAYLFRALLGYNRGRGDDISSKVLEASPAVSARYQANGLRACFFLKKDTILIRSTAPNPDF